MTLKKGLCGLLLLLCGCSTFQPVPTKTLESHQLVGHWESAEGHMNIYCSGAFSAKLIGDTPVAPTSSDTPSHVTSGLRIEKIEADGLVLGSFMPGSRQYISVKDWPHIVGNTWQMKADGTTWTRTSVDSCQ